MVSMAAVAMSAAEPWMGVLMAARMAWPLALPPAVSSPDVRSNHGWTHEIEAHAGFTRLKQLWPDYSRSRLSKRKLVIKKQSNNDGFAQQACSACGGADNAMGNDAGSAPTFLGHGVWKLPPAAEYCGHIPLILGLGLLPCLPVPHLRSHTYEQTVSALNRAAVSM